MQPSRVVFLDIDGVLVNRASLRLPRIASAIGTIRPAHSECVEALNRITDVTGAELVMSSSWREEGDIELLADILRQWGVTGTLIGKTPVIEGTELYSGSTRGDEIQAWLDEADRAVSAFVILDDGNDMAHLRPSLVQTDSDAGLTMRDAERAIVMLQLPRGDISRRSAGTSPRASQGRATPKLTASSDRS